MECWSPVTVSVLEVDEASLGCTNSLRPRRQPEREAWLTGGSPCCERSELMWGKTEESGQSAEVYLANTWSCSGCRLASLQTLWHKAETLWHVFNFSWPSWLFSMISFSLSAFCEMHTTQQSKHYALERKEYSFIEGNMFPLPVWWFHTADCICSLAFSCGSAEQRGGSCCAVSCRGRTPAVLVWRRVASAAAGSRFCSNPRPSRQRTANAPEETRTGDQLRRGLSSKRMYKNKKTVLFVPSDC